MSDDILILGGGVIGLSLAYELAGRGLAVRVLDRGEPGKEASWAGAGILPPCGQLDTDPLAQLTRLSTTLHRQWSAELRDQIGIDNGYRPCGGLYVARSAEDAANLESEFAEFQAVELASQWLQRGDLPSVEPLLADACPPVLAAIRLPDEAQIRNPWHLKALIAACAARGVNIEAGAAVTSIAVRGGMIRHVETALGPRQAARYILAGGAWTAAWTAPLGLNLPVYPVRGQMALLATTGRTLSHIINQGKQYLVPRADGRILVGSTEDDAGFDKRNTAEGVASLLALAQGLAPALGEATLEKCCAALRPFTPDGLPYIGPVPEVENALLATGHFRSGLTLSTGTARVLAQLLCDEPLDVPLAAFAPARAGTPPQAARA
mgnify:CR=1 FL=1